MTQTVDELLAGLIRTFDRLEDLARLGHERYRVDPLVRWSVQRLWITAGNYAEEYRRVAGLGAGTAPWAELYGYRSLLAHSLDEELSDDRVWYETVDDLPRLRHEAQAAHGS